MTVASTEFYYQPVPQWKHLDRLAVVPSRFDARGFWTEVHHDVQEQLAVLESDVRQSVAEFERLPAARAASISYSFPTAHFHCPTATSIP